MTHAKWLQKQRNLKEDDVVLLIDKQLPQNEWQIGLVTETIKGNKGLVRSVKVRTNIGTSEKPQFKEYHRPVVKCCLLEAAPDESVEEDTITVTL
jgi:hypothetical protein